MLGRYLKLINIHEKRKIKENIIVAFKGFINIFEKEDKNMIINILFNMKYFTDFIQSCIIMVLYIYISKYMYKNFIYANLVIIFLSIIQIFYLTSNIDIEHLKKEFCLISKFNSKFAKYIIFKRLISENIKSMGILVFLPYIISIIFIDIFYYNNFLAMLVSLIFIMPIILIFIIILILFKTRCLDILKNSSDCFRCLYLKQSLKVDFKNIKKSTGIDLFIKKEISKNKKIDKIRFFVIILTLCLIILNLVNHSLRLNVQLIYIFIITFFPSAINIALINFLFRELLKFENIISTYYLISKFKLKHTFIKITCWKTIRIMKISLLPIIAITLMNISINYIIILICLSIVLLNIILLLSIRIYNISNISIEDLNSNTLQKLYQNNLEDLLIMGLPFICISLFIIQYIEKNSLSLLTNFMLIYSTLFILYNLMKIRLLKVKEKKNA